MNCRLSPDHPDYRVNVDTKFQRGTMPIRTLWVSPAWRLWYVRYRVTHDGRCPCFRCAMERVDQAV